MDDAVVWRDYHVDEINKLDKEIATLKEELNQVKAAEWLAASQKDILKTEVAKLTTTLKAAEKENERLWGAIRPTPENLMVYAQVAQAGPEDFVAAILATIGSRTDGHE